ncbi:transposase [Alicyclobacillus acidoterrestris]|uniref:transposase n=1 Tax=Alicyclobacillus acidoterrestris TaxID=1450 RepID=UPI003F535226
MDTASELPVALDVTPANVFDGEMAAPLLEHVVTTHGWKIDFVMMDAGYDKSKTMKRFINMVHRRYTTSELL